jgi:alpha 1,3-glucosidase
MVTIVDPHIKKDDDYYISRQAKGLDIFVKDKSGADFEGMCWPGTSNWIDYTNPAGRKFWAEQFLYENYKGSTESLYTWNDMNEVRVGRGRFSLILC